MVLLRGTRGHKSNKSKGKNTKVDDCTIEELNGVNRRDRKWFNHLEGIYGGNCEQQEGDLAMALLETYSIHGELPLNKQAYLESNIVVSCGEK